MKTKHIRERLLASSMIGGFALVGLTATQAFAQDAPPAAGGAVAVQELVVTGSRIPQRNMTSISPIQTVNSQEVAISGRPATIDLLNQLPQVTINSAIDLGPTSNPLSGPGGVGTVDLRGLGPQRTLVLIDGRRLGIGDPNTGNPNSAPDINQIPSQLIDRVEVLTGGASAVYGSDAVAGVVNFVMKRNFEGVQLDAQYGVNQHSQHNDLMQGLLRAKKIPVPDSKWDGKSVDYSLIMGANAPDGRGNITTYFTYHQQDPVTQFQRDYSACQLNIDPKPRCAGSSNSNIFYRADGTGDNFSVLGNQFVPWGTPGTTPPQRFNSNEYAYLVQGNTRYTGGYFAKYEINDNFKLYSDFSFMHDRTRVVIAPSALFQGDGVSDTGGFLVNCSNPFLSAQQQSAIGCASAADVVDMYIGRRNVEGGGRDFLYDHQNYRVVFGSKGNLYGPFDYDLYASYYYTSMYQKGANYLSKSRAQNALLVDGTAANPVCRSGGGCVPWNIFQDGGVTPEALSYLLETGTSRGTMEERIVEGVINGDLGEYGIKSPWATDAVRVAMGFQIRRDHLDYAPDQAELSNDLAGAGGASVTINNSLRTSEFFAELRTPLIQDAPWAKELSVSAGYRYSDYSTGVTADTYKVGLEWAPTSDVRFRGSFNRAIRAPNIIELYTPQSVTNTSQISEDPCAQNATSPATLDQCIRTGVTASQYNNQTIPQCPSGQCAVLTGGNVALNPERANTYTVGFLLTPQFIPGLFASVDYFNIDMKGTIGAIPLGVIMQKCLTTGDSNYCSQIVRNSTNGILFGSSKAAGGYIVGTNVNVGASTTSGVDLQAAYRLGFDRFGHDDWGHLTFNLNGTWLRKATSTPYPGGETYDCAGLYGPQCQTVNPHWRHTLATTWSAPHDVQLTATWRYIGKATLETDTNEPIIGAGGHDPYNHKIKAVSYFDLAADWNVNEKLAVRAGINNVFDKNPPLINSLIAGTGLPNSYPTYDLLGRHMFVALTARF